MPEDSTEVQFQQLIERLDAGGFLEEVEEELREEVRSVQKSGKTGKLKIAVKIRPDGGEDAKHIFFEPSVTRKRPKATRPSTLLYADREARLHGSDPDQIDMDLQPAPEDDSGPLRKVETG